MGQRNMHMIDLDRGQDFIRAEPCVVYGSIPNLPQPSIHTVVRGRPANFDLHQISEHHENALVYGVAAYNQYPAGNLNLAVASSSNHYTPFLAPPSASSEIFIPVNHGTHDQLAFPSDPRMGGLPADGYIRNNAYVDGVSGSFKRKNSEGHPWNLQYNDALAGSSSAVGPAGNRSLESDATPTNTVPFVLPGANDPSSIIEGGSFRSVRNGSGVIVPDSVMAHNPNHLIQGNYVGQPFLLPGNPWLGLQLGSNSGDMSSGRWNQPAALPYLSGSMNGNGMDAVNMGLQAYQVGPQGTRPVLRPPMPVQSVGGQNMNFTLQVPATSRRLPTNSTTINYFQGVLETGPRYVGNVPPTGVRFYRPHRWESTPEMNARHRSVPHLRVLPEDGVAIMEFSGHRDDQHRDMRMDIDHMSYEELLALGEQIGSVGTGLTEEAIESNLKVRLFVSSVASPAVDESPDAEHKLDSCVICQADYVNQERLATLDCGHEYHVDCLKKWLVVKNACPICKSAALTAERKDS